ncbi:FAD/NAD(P)-binding protein [Arhodomonas sp. AD133]|uniref:FAD/NAD(P)-binding protein n=1 Tax=Arhodomonas sp. AD133 TaxID=3415009 RepID=UPI003EB94E98
MAMQYDDDPMRPVPVRVVRRRRETAEIWTLELSRDDTAPAVFAPGQFNMLYAFGVGEVPISVSGDPDARTRWTHTVRAVGPVSRALVGTRTGQTLGLRGPFGNGWPQHAGARGDLLVIAGGLGLAPLRPMLYHALHRSRDFRRLTLIYGARSPTDLLFHRELERWRRRGHMDVLITVDHAGGDWRGRVGVVTDVLASATFDAASVIALICGPELMMRFTVAALRALGVDDAAMYVSLERNMKCAIGHCGHCQLGPELICRDGPVLPVARLRGVFGREAL